MKNPTRKKEGIMEKQGLSKFSVTFVIVLSVFVAFGTLAHAEVGVTDTEIRIGTINDTTGPVAAYGVPRVEALNALIRHVNEQGGIYGRQIKPGSDAPS